MYKDLSFGSYLRACRQDLGMSLEQIENITKIQKHILLAIEQQDMDVLPEDIFVKGFLRTYASVLGVNGPDLVRRYTAYKEKTVPKKTEITEPAPSLSYNRNIIICLVGFIGIILLVLFLER